jgi:hypothetical protein
MSGLVDGASQDRTGARYWECEELSKWFPTIRLANTVGGPAHALKSPNMPLEVRG